MREYSNFGTASTIKDTLRRRLVNLMERGMVLREGNVYIIEPKGMDYAATFSKVEGDQRREIMHAVKAHNDDQREALRKQLSVMPPFRFEHLIRELLEAMGYVVVAGASLALAGAFIAYVVQRLI